MRILKEYFSKYPHGKDNLRFKEHNKGLRKMMEALPSDIKRFEAMAKADEMYEMLRLQGVHVPILIKINSETRSLEEIARQYRISCNRDSSKPLLIEFSQMYEDIVEFYKNRDKS